MNTARILQVVSYFPPAYTFGGAPRASFLIFKELLGEITTCWYILLMQGLLNCLYARCHLEETIRFPFDSMAACAPTSWINWTFILEMCAFSPKTVSKLLFGSLLTKATMHPASPPRLTLTLMALIDSVSVSTALCRQSKRRFRTFSNFTDTRFHQWGLRTRRRPQRHIVVEVVVLRGVRSSDEKLPCRCGSRLSEGKSNWEHS